MARTARSASRKSPALSMSKFVLFTKDLCRAFADIARVLRSPNRPAARDHPVRGFVAGGLPGSRLLIRLATLSSVMTPCSDL